MLRAKSIIFFYFLIQLVIKCFLDSFTASNEMAGFDDFELEAALEALDLLVADGDS